MDCNPKCYTNGKACAISDDGACAIDMYGKFEKDYIKNFKAAQKTIEEQFSKSNVKPQSKTKG